MNSIGMLLVILLILPLNAMAELQPGRDYSFESFNYPGRFIRHKNFILHLDPEESGELFRKDATFRVVAGLADSAHVSFASVNYPGYYLRHQGFKLKLQKYASDHDKPLFEKDATFLVRPGLADKAGVSFESYNYPGRLIRHRNFRLHLALKENVELFRGDATFHARSPRWSTERTIKDTDGDRLTDRQERILGTQMQRADSDGNGIDDYTQLLVLGQIPPPDRLPLPRSPDDRDGDGLTNEEEEQYGTDPDKADTDDDYLLDSYEALDWGRYGTSPTDPDGDRDGLVDGREIWWACDPHRGDTDADGFSDHDEVDLPIGNPRKGDGIPYTQTSLQGKDSDHDGIPVGAEAYDVGTDPRDPSTDGDRYSDGMEFLGHDFYSGEDLPDYVKGDPFTPATADIVLSMAPEVKLNLAKTVKTGEKQIDKGEHSYTVDRVEEIQKTVEAGVNTSVEMKTGFPTWPPQTEIKVTAYLNIGRKSTSTFSQTDQTKELSASEAYRATETDLSGSKLQVWLQIRNAGNDILLSPLKEITVNFYMGNDTHPFHTEILREVFTNLKPGDNVTVEREIPINFESFQRFQAGEGVEVTVAHYSFGEDQIWLENAKASSFQLDISYGNKAERHYILAENEPFMDVAQRAGVTIELSEDSTYVKSVNGYPIATRTPPYKWWSLTFEKLGEQDTEVLKRTTLPDLKVGPGESALLRYGIDTDGDMLPDNEERKIGTSLDNQDTDGDGLTDGDSFQDLGLKGERQYGTNPLLKDTDFDRYEDKEEVEKGTDPLDAASYPRETGDGGGEPPDEDSFKCPSGQRCCEPGPGKCLLCIPMRGNMHCP